MADLNQGGRIAGSKRNQCSLLAHRGQLHLLSPHQAAAARFLDGSSSQLPRPCLTPRRNSTGLLRMMIFLVTAAPIGGEGSSHRRPTRSSPNLRPSLKLTCSLGPMRLQNRCNPYPSAQPRNHLRDRRQSPPHLLPRDQVGRSLLSARKLWQRRQSIAWQGQATSSEATTPRHTHPTHQPWLPCPLHILWQFSSWPTEP